MTAPKPKSQLVSLRKTMKSLRLRPEHEALVAQCEGLAAALDARPTHAALWREYRPALELLFSAGEVEPDDGQAQLLELVRTPVGNAKKAGTGNARARGGGGGEVARPAADAVATAGRGRRSRAAS